MKTLSIVTQKGGEAKTTTALALSSGLTLRGYRVLSVDLDPQCSFSHVVGAKTDGAASLGLLTREGKAEDAIQDRGDWGEVIPASRGLSGADAYIRETGKEFRLREALEPILKEYHYVILDTPPSLGIITINALTASSSVIVPAQPSIFSLEGIQDLAETIQTVKRYCNPSLRIEGLLLTRYSSRSILNNDIADLAGELATTLGTKLFQTRIRDAVAIREAQISQEPIFQYAPKAKVTQDYRDFLEEILEAAE